MRAPARILVFSVLRFLNSSIPQFLNSVPPPGVEQFKYMLANEFISEVFRVGWKSVRKLQPDQTGNSDQNRRRFQGIVNVDAVGDTVVRFARSSGLVVSAAGEADVQAQADPVGYPGFGGAEDPVGQTEFVGKISIKSAARVIPDGGAEVRVAESQGRRKG